MKQNLINDVIQEMLPYLNNGKSEKLKSVMQHILLNMKYQKIQIVMKNLKKTIYLCLFQQRKLTVVLTKH